MARRMIFTLVLAALVASLAPAQAGGYWVLTRIDDRSLPSDRPAVVNVGNWLIGYGHGDATVFADPGALAGHATAQDYSLGRDVTVAHKDVDWRVEIWRKRGSGVGEVEVFAQADIAGEVILADATCAAVALGYCEFDSNAMANPVRAELLHAAGETQSDLLATVGAQVQGVGISVPITVATGEGTYPDSDSDANVGYLCPTAITWFITRTAGYLRCHANGNPLPYDLGLAYASISDTSRVVFTKSLRVLPACP